MERFELDKGAVAALGRSNLAMKVMFLLAARSATAARQLAPVKEGKYKRSISADSGIEKGVATGRVKAGDFKANWIETGTINQAPRAPITRGVEATLGQTPTERHTR